MAQATKTINVKKILEELIKKHNQQTQNELSDIKEEKQRTVNYNNRLAGILNAIEKYKPKRMYLPAYTNRNGTLTNSLYGINEFKTILKRDLMSERSGPSLSEPHIGFGIESKSITTTPVRSTPAQIPAMAMVTSTPITPLIHTNRPNYITPSSITQSTPPAVGEGANKTLLETKIPVFNGAVPALERRLDALDGVGELAQATNIQEPFDPEFDDINALFPGTFGQLQPPFVPQSIQEKQRYNSQLKLMADSSRDVNNMYKQTEKWNTLKQMNILTKRMHQERFKEMLVKENINSIMATHFPEKKIEELTPDEQANFNELLQIYNNAGLHYAMADQGMPIEMYDEPTMLELEQLIPMGDYSNFNYKLITKPEDYGNAMWQSKLRGQAMARAENQVRRIPPPQEDIVIARAKLQMKQVGKDKIWCRQHEPQFYGARRDNDPLAPRNWTSDHNPGQSLIQSAKQPL